jgi:IMP dehydrogenase/GMP reductase
MIMFCQAAEMEEEFGETTEVKKSTSFSRLGGAESDSDDEEGEEELDHHKYDESEVVVNERDDLAIRMFMHK